MANKILIWSELNKILERDKQENKNIVFTNGCFDIVHVGHLRYLTEGAKLGDILVVGINSDESIKRIKGLKRPINHLDERMEIIAGFSCVDYVTSFNEDTPLKLIQTILPGILIKGADWDKSKIIGASIVEELGGKVETIPLIPGRSSSNVIQTVLSRFCKDATD